MKKAGWSVGVRAGPFSVTGNASAAMAAAL